MVPELNESFSTLFLGVSSVCRHEPFIKLRSTPEFDLIYMPIRLTQEGAIGSGVALSPRSTHGVFLS
jgi:hypothetical protein